MFSAMKPLNSAGIIGDMLPTVKSEIKSILRKVVAPSHMSPVIANRVIDYYSHCLDYNIVGGKLSRARTVVEAYATCSRNPIASDSDEVRAAIVLGWAVEIMQAFFLIEDDVMDRGEFRRGRPCWYKVPDVGVANGINDGLLLEQVLYELISTNEYTKPFALSAHSILRNASMRTVVGQHLDTHPPSTDQYNRDQWLSVVRFKTAFYTFLLPCELGILVSGKSFTALDLQTFEKLTLLIGELFQAQDDMLDCFSDPKIIGKVGRDIEEGKCTWLWYTAMDSSDFDKKAELLSLHASQDTKSVLRVKKIYKELGIDLKFQQYTEKISSEISKEISNLQSSELVSLSNWLLESIHNRKK